jgi:hypothetical protein
MAKKATITKLYQRFENAHDTMRAIPSKDQKAFDRAVSKCSDIARQVVNAPARDIEEMLLKIRVTRWTMDCPTYETLEDLDHLPLSAWAAREQSEALFSLREDLLRFQGRRMAA